MDFAIRISKESYATRKQVGAVVVTENSGMFTGFNGTPSGMQNVCECPESGLTTDRVIHAEMNCFMKMLREGVSAKGSTVYVTLSPCEGCLSKLYQAGVSRVVYLDEYKESDHLEDYRKLGMVIQKFDQLIYPA